MARSTSDPDQEYSLLFLRLPLSMVPCHHCLPFRSECFDRSRSEASNSATARGRFEIF